MYLNTMFALTKSKQMVFATMAYFDCPSEYIIFIFVDWAYLEVATQRISIRCGRTTPATVRTCRRSSTCAAHRTLFAVSDDIIVVRHFKAPADVSHTWNRFLVQYSPPGGAQAVVRFAHNSAT